MPRVRQLYDAGAWRDVVSALPESSYDDANLQLYKGLALARLQRADEARQTLQSGADRHPRDARFPIELGGIAYQRSNFALAKRELRRGLTLDPRDNYANTFLASIYFLEGNLEAALKYWNRSGKPKLGDLKFEPRPKINPLILDRALKFSPDTEWSADRYLTTRAQLEALRLYSTPIFDLQARPEEAFDLTIRAPERNGWGSTPWEGGLSLLRGLPYQSVYPEFYNLGHTGLNWRSLVRWDDQKRRIFSELAAPLGNDPAVRIRAYFDGRNENWNLSNTLLPNSTATAGMNLEKAAAGAEIQFIPSGRWRWSTGVEYSYRNFRNVTGVPDPAEPFFTSGSSLALRARVERSLIRLPERRFTLDGSAAGEAGTFFQDPLGRYGRLEGALTGHWYPQARGDDFELLAGVKAGKTFGVVPFDELFSAGFERDTDLFLRGHPDLRRGQKGSGPLGRDFVVINSEFDKIVYYNGIFAVRAGPFLDSGRTYDSSGLFGTRNGLWDTGLQTKIRVLGSVEFVLGYGKDLRTGRNSFFTKVSR